MALVGIFSSPRLVDCEQRALVLRAVGIEHVLVQVEDLHVLLTPEELAPKANEQLKIYEQENRPRPVVPLPKLHEHAWAGSMVFAVVLMAVAYGTGHSSGGVDWITTGALTRAAVHGDEGWRLITALTLHADIEHLIGNLVFGVPYGFFASQLLGGGRAWASILCAATLANAVESALMDMHHVTLGASTAVFAMLALVAAYSSQIAIRDSSRWALRWSPWIAAVALLAMTGTGGEHTDVLAHAIGFAAGALFGLLQAYLPNRWLDRPATQVASGGLALAAVISAWLWALRM